MANSATQPLDASDLGGRDVLQGEGAGHSFSLLDSAPLGKTARTPVADLALDLALNEIVQQARLATTATGATIRLVVAGQLVCRAAAGTTAAEISAYLKLRAGILEACVATGRTQRCDDAETDPRLDAVSCRRLGLRSFLVVPVRRLDQDTVGVIEIFSARARTFSDRDALALQAFARRVFANIDLVAKIMPTAFGDRVSPISIVDRFQPEARASDSTLRLVPRTKPYFVRTQMLLLLWAIATVCLLVGWMLGRAGRQRLSASSDLRPQVSQALKLPSTVPSLVSAPPIKANVTAISSAERTSSPATRAPATPTKSLPVEASAVRVLAKPKPNDGLVVYQNSLVTQKAQTSLPATFTSTELRDALLVPDEIVNPKLVKRVEPQYPKRAIEQHIQGGVLLEVDVDQAGAVQGIYPISGNPLLTTAAEEAVRQWRFEPHLKNRKQMNFKTHVALNFALP